MLLFVTSIARISGKSIINTRFSANVLFACLAGDENRREGIRRCNGPLNPGREWQLTAPSVPSHVCTCTARQWSTQDVEVRYRPVQAQRFQQAFDKPGRLPQRQNKQNFDGQVCLNGRITIGPVTSSLA